MFALSVFLTIKILRVYFNDKCEFFSLKFRETKTLFCLSFLIILLNPSTSSSIYDFISTLEFNDISNTESFESKILYLISFFIVNAFCIDLLINFVIKFFLSLTKFKLNQVSILKNISQLISLCCVGVTINSVMHYSYFTFYGGTAFELFTRKNLSSLRVVNKDSTYPSYLSNLSESQNVFLPTKFFVLSGRNNSGLSTIPFASSKQERKQAGVSKKHLDKKKLPTSQTQGPFASGGFRDQLSEQTARHMKEKIQKQGPLRGLRNNRLYLTTNLKSGVAQGSSLSSSTVKRSPLEIFKTLSTSPDPGTLRGTERSPVPLGQPLGADELKLRTGEGQPQGANEYRQEGNASVSSKDLGREPQLIQVLPLKGTSGEEALAKTEQSLDKLKSQYAISKKLEKSLIFPYLYMQESSAAYLDSITSLRGAPLVDTLVPKEQEGQPEGADELKPGLVKTLEGSEEGSLLNNQLIQTSYSFGLSTNYQPDFWRNFPVFFKRRITGRLIPFTLEDSYNTYLYFFGDTIPYEPLHRKIALKPHSKKMRIFKNNKQYRSYSSDSYKKRTVNLFFDKYQKKFVYPIPMSMYLPVEYFMYSYSFLRTDLDIDEAYNKFYTHIINKTIKKFNFLRYNSRTLTPSALDCKKKVGIIYENYQDLKFSLRRTVNYFNLHEIEDYVFLNNGLNSPDVALLRFGTHENSSRRPPSVSSKRSHIPGLVEEKLMPSTSKRGEQGKSKININNLSSPLGLSGRENFYIRLRQLKAILNQTAYKPISLSGPTQSKSKILSYRDTRGGAWFQLSSVESV